MNTDRNCLFGFSLEVTISCNYACFLLYIQRCKNWLQATIRCIFWCLHYCSLPSLELENEVPLRKFLVGGQREENHMVRDQGNRMVVEEQECGALPGNLTSGGNL
ncbi:hypothetical protein AVEN_41709-1 [Araneus ventricosus]|uniref:Uncharacterized protein n=1 Tax=Araneus ventricosus TaxID=182803 RepID=A0A4Y2AD63_ARAVE|nr:hypothetical protein AVEN_41709-1 [Araneus ventricosus]